LAAGQEQGIIREFWKLEAVRATLARESLRDFRGLRENSLLHRNREFNSAYQGKKFSRTGKELGRTGKRLRPVGEAL
jgi:hypothetical protein